ncbi:MAG: hypothetical protein WCD66_06605 [Rhodanobacteraceae bacterium]
MPHKIIRNPSDLVINGAPPAFEEPLRVGRPRIGDHDAFLRRANQILDGQWLTNNGLLVEAPDCLSTARKSCRDVLLALKPFGSPIATALVRNTEPCHPVRELLRIRWMGLQPSAV